MNLNILVLPGDGIGTEVTREAVRVLRCGGRVIVVENEQRLDESSGDKPQIVLRRWLEHAGVHCERIKAVAAGEMRLLLGVGQKV